MVEYNIFGNTWQEYTSTKTYFETVVISLDGKSISNKIINLCITLVKYP